MLEYIIGQFLYWSLFCLGMWASSIYYPTPSDAQAGMCVAISAGSSLIITASVLWIRYKIWERSFNK